MKTIAVISQKGGAGKTTIAFHLAVEAERRGYPSIIFDTDSQASAGKLYDLRVQHTEHPEVVSEHSERLGQKLGRVEKAGAQLSVIDTAPHSQSDTLAAAKFADYLVIPCRPGILDLDAIRKTVDIVALSQKPAAVVLNAVRPRADSLVLEAKQAIAGLGLSIAPVQLGNRAAFADSLIEGKVAQEYEPSGKAAREIRKLFDWIWSEIEV